MKIVVLDGYTANPGDLSWTELEQFGQLTVYDRTPPETVRERAAGAEVLLTNKTALDRKTLEALPELKYIGVLATGVNVVDLEAARDRGVTVTNVPGYSTAAVAQMTLALLLELTRQVGHHARLVREGRWAESPDFCFWDRPQVELEGATLGLVGFGQIGRRVAALARALGMWLLVHTRHPERHREEPEASEVEFVGLERLFRDSDVVSLHCPLTAETEGLVDAERLALMKPTAYLINTGRGPLVDETALTRALNSGQLAGAGLDVLTAEPPPEDHPLTTARNCFVTPHIAWATKASRCRLISIAAANLGAFIAGKPVNTVVG